MITNYFLQINLLKSEKKNSTISIVWMQFVIYEIVRFVLGVVVVWLVGWLGCVLFSDSDAVSHAGFAPTAGWINPKLPNWLWCWWCRTLLSILIQPFVLLFIEFRCHRRWAKNKRPKIKKTKPIPHVLYIIICVFFFCVGNISCNWFAHWAT